MGLSILVVEDDLLLRKQLAAELERVHADVTGAGTLAEARRQAAGQSFDFVLLDINLPDGEGLDLVREKLFPQNTGLIIMTAHGGVAGAVEAMRLGALDYLLKPLEPGVVTLAITRARQARQAVRLEEHRRSDHAQTGEVFYFGLSLADLERQLRKIVAADLPETLAEAELFGHERGAFTDARTTRIGLFEAADGGTLFLDELPSLSLALQAKVLKAIEERRIRRLGGPREIAVDVRVVAATHRDLGKLITTGQFREDLFYRLDLYRVAIPPLRIRGEDIIKLAELLVADLCRRHRLPLKKITAAGRKRLRAYHWPGNVRELSHELERAIVFQDSEELDFEHLQAPEGQDRSALLGSSEWLNPNFRFPPQGFDLEAAIVRLIHQALAQADGNASAAARLLGVSRDYLRYHLKGQE
jgi:DNA-binding NtrC family response regulator